MKPTKRANPVEAKTEKAGRSSEIAVAHLVRPAHGIGAFERFLSAYSKLDAGIEHKLILIFKGFTEGDEFAEYRRLAADTPHLGLSVPDVRFDIGAYVEAARSFPFEFFCFLNSHSAPIASGWLEKLYRHASRDGVGVVGATASYESPLQAWCNDESRSGRGAVGAARKLIRRLPIGARFRAALERQWMFRLGAFPAFPNAHLRSNGFLIRRDVFLRLSVGKLADKWDAYEFESGRWSLTAQIRSMGLEVLVTGQDGKAYDIAHWPESRTFRSGGQENLLIADNHTRYFDEADFASARYVSTIAWGARPEWSGGL